MTKGFAVIAWPSEYKVMTQATVPEDEDAIEKATWAALAPFFPHYEEFWRILLVPLRSTGSMHPSRGIDDDFQFLAMQHYSLHVTLGKAYERILEPEAIASKSTRMPAPAVNPTKANLPTTAKTKTQPSQAHQGKSDGLINITAHYMLGRPTRNSRESSTVYFAGVHAYFSGL